MTCDFESTQLLDGTYQHHCRRCGRKTTSTMPRHNANCKQVGTFAKLKSITKDFFNWSVSGFQTRTTPEQDRLLTICRSCPFIRSKGAAEWCGRCGCSLSERSALPSKLLWATSTCPLGKWTEPPVLDAPPPVDPAAPD